MIYCKEVIFRHNDLAKESLVEIILWALYLGGLSTIFVQSQGCKYECQGRNYVKFHLHFMFSFLAFTIYNLVSAARQNLKCGIVCSTL